LSGCAAQASNADFGGHFPQGAYIVQSMGPSPFIGQDVSE
jgi:hypothetical protein